MCPVELRPSSISGAGEGVFARTAIPAGAFVTPFDGRLVPMHTCETSKTWDYEYQMAHGAHLVPSLTKRADRGLGHLLNDAIHADVTGRSNNCKFHELDRATLWVRTRQAVAAGDELLVPYGFQYWCSRARDARLSEHVRDWCTLQCATNLHLMRVPGCEIVEEYLGCDGTGSKYSILRRTASGAPLSQCDCYTARSACVHVDASDHVVRCGACAAPIPLTTTATHA